MTAGLEPSRKRVLSDLDAQFRGPLMLYFRRRGAAQVEAEDLTQEVFLRLARLPEVETLEVADRYIFTVAVNLLRDRARRARAQQSDQHLRLDSDDVAGFGDALVEALEPERILLSREVLARVLEALNDVGPRTRGVFLLFRLEGMKQREIAHLYGISVSAVEKHIVKALKRLACELGQP